MDGKAASPAVMVPWWAASISAARSMPRLAPSIGCMVAAAERGSSAYASSTAMRRRRGSVSFWRTRRFSMAASAWSPRNSPPATIRDIHALRPEGYQRGLRFGGGVELPLAPSFRPHGVHADFLCRLQCEGGWPVRNGAGQFRQRRKSHALRPRLPHRCRDPDKPVRLHSISAAPMPAWRPVSAV